MSERQTVYPKPEVQDALQEDIERYGKEGYRVERLTQSSAHLVRPRLHSSTVAIGVSALGALTAFLLYFLWFQNEREREMDLNATSSVTVTASGELPPPE